MGRRLGVWGPVMNAFFAFRPFPVRLRVCREGSRSACSGSSWRSSTWLTQAPCPSCWRRRRTAACTATTSASRKDPPTSPFSGTRSPSRLSVVVFNSAGNHIVFSTLSPRVPSSSRSPIKCVISRRFSYGTREKVLRWLFPKAELCPLLDSAGTIVQRCLVTHSTNSQSKVSSPERTQV